MIIFFTTSCVISVKAGINEPRSWLHDFMCVEVLLSSLQNFWNTFFSSLWLRPTDLKSVDLIDLKTDVPVLPLLLQPCLFSFSQDYPTHILRVLREQTASSITCFIKWWFFSDLSLFTGPGHRFLWIVAVKRQGGCKEGQLWKKFTFNWIGKNIILLEFIADMRI